MADEGLRGLSMRKVAARAGSTRGGVTSRAGRKSELIASLFADMLVFQHAKHERWLALTQGMDLASENVLAAVIAAFLDEANTHDRSQSIVLCELMADCARR
ncbi:hypothetical protein ABVV53_11750 [Novosphingobium sp. RD2P27]|uniref:TetR family transcriptional regulator n=1 Tax=Novosphingobium kalidii TaxID=3230299 RepID=A0ABV2D2P3_9SPHN